MLRELLILVVALSPAPQAAPGAVLPASCENPVPAIGTYVDLEIAIPGARWITATGLNERRDVIGIFADEGSSLTQSFLWSRNELTLLAVPGATSTYAADINASGTVVGAYEDAAGRHGFSWRRGRFTLYPRSPWMRALDFRAINNSGAIAGSYGVQPEGETAFVWHASGTTEIDVSDRPWDFPVSINDRFDVLLISYRRPGPGRGQYFVASRDVIEPVQGCGDLDGFQGLLHTVTNDGTLVGRRRASSSSFSGVAYTTDGVTLFDYPGAESTELIDMNSAGYAVGTATIGTGRRVFMFVPHGR